MVLRKNEEESEARGKLSQNLPNIRDRAVVELRLLTTLTSLILPTT